jgi:hypothetical protein
MAALNFAMSKRSKYSSNNLLQIANHLEFKLNYNMAYLYYSNCPLFQINFSNLSIFNAEKHKLDPKTTDAILKSAQQLSKLYKFNILQMADIFEQYSHLIKTKTGLFFFHEFDYQKLNHSLIAYPEFTNLTNFIKNQTIAAK